MSKSHGKAIPERVVRAVSAKPGVDLLTHEATPSHWSTTSTVEAAVDDLYASYFVPKCKEQSLDPANTYWLICWDVYLSHRDSALLARLKAKYVSFNLT